MNVFAEMLRRMGALFGMGAFGFTLAGALMSGSDPLWAMVRAGVSGSILMMLYWTLCRTLVPLLGANPVPVTHTDGAETAEPNMKAA